MINSEQQKFLRQNIKKLLKELRKKLDKHDEDEDSAGDKTSMIRVTLATTDGVTLSCQIGDNSVPGDAYAHPHWSVQTLTRDTNVEQLAAEIADELQGLVDADRLSLEHDAEAVMQKYEAEIVRSERSTQRRSVSPGHPASQRTDVSAEARLWT